ncbi:hypothetical protein FF38_12848 [Lucilia cuprina]|uniref:Uncharacterized protein n=1 Tax=Lucilia cuprina TaxID=7375 RepID=A0A0L0CH15_LUCCU|nr:hypothetical protein FF38_12848 [Lucilia cuprina]
MLMSLKVVLLNLRSTLLTQNDDDHEDKDEAEEIRRSKIKKWGHKQQQPAQHHVSNVETLLAILNSIAHICGKIVQLVRTNITKYKVNIEDEEEVQNTFVQQNKHQAMAPNIMQLFMKDQDNRLVDRWRQLLATCKGSDAAMMYMDFALAALLKTTSGDLKGKKGKYDLKYSILHTHRLFLGLREIPKENVEDNYDITQRHQAAAFSFIG